MGKRSAVVELFLGDMGSMQRELRPSKQKRTFSALILRGFLKRSERHVEAKFIEL
jgi:hypothetical protein